VATRFVFRVKIEIEKLALPKAEMLLRPVPLCLVSHSYYFSYC
jgi:hypothetical protein